MAKLVVYRIYVLFIFSLTTFILSMRITVQVEQTPKFSGTKDVWLPVP